MGIELTLSGSSVEPARSMRLCANQGFDQVAEWAAKLPKGDYSAVDAFFRDLSFAPTNVLATQLNTAANEHGPSDRVTSETLTLLLDRIGMGYPGETVTVSPA